MNVTHCYNDIITVHFSARNKSLSRGPFNKDSSARFVSVAVRRDGSGSVVGPGKTLPQVNRDLMTNVIIFHDMGETVCEPNHIQPCFLASRIVLTLSERLPLLNCRSIGIGGGALSSS
jgi:hypothetical protein